MVYSIVAIVHLASKIYIYIYITNLRSNLVEVLFAL